MGSACCKNKKFSIEPSSNVIAVQPAIKTYDNSKGLKSVQKLKNIFN
jgi:hypothetical protein